MQWQFFTPVFVGGPVLHAGPGVHLEGLGGVVEADHLGQGLHGVPGPEVGGGGDLHPDHVPAAAADLPDLQRHDRMRMACWNCS